MTKLMSSFLRTAFVTTVLAGLVVLGYRTIRDDQKQRAIDELKALNTQMQDTLALREAMITRLSRSRRVAHLEVLQQQMDAASKVTQSTVLFIELDEQGTELARQTFSLPGDVVFVDAWTVKFDPQLVAEGDPFHGKTLVLLRRMYTDRMPPSQGLAIDTPGAIPPGYAGGDIGRFEQQLWANFWSIATDSKRAAELGVRIAQGEAVYKPMRTGQHYELIVDAVGGMSLMPLDAAKERAASLSRASN